MTLNWMMFLPALVLLFVPLEIFFPKQLRLKELSYLDFSASSVRRRGPWRLPVIWADGVRSFAGGFLLCTAWHLEPGAGALHRVPVAASLVILAFATIVQMHTRRTEAHFIAPVTYMVGIWFAVTSWPLVAVAVGAGAVCMAAFRSLPAFFFFGAATLGVFGVVGLHAGPWAVVAAAVGLLPCVLSLMLGRTLAVPMRAEVVQQQQSRVVPVVRDLNLDQAEKLKA